MSDLRLTFIGSGNAFSPEGLCCNGFLVNERYLFDAPPHSLSSLNTVKVDPNALDAVVISHHHGDHFLGLPFLLLHWKWKGRTRPVRVVGPPETEALARDIAQKVFPGVFDNIVYDLQFEELRPGGCTKVDDLEIHPVQVQHDDGLVMSLGYSCRVGTRRFGYTGDTILCQGVLDLARDAEVLVSECASRADKVPVHMNLLDDIPQVRAAMQPSSHLILTHITPDVDTNGLPNTSVAEDFKRFEF